MLTREEGSDRNLVRVEKREFQDRIERIQSSLEEHGFDGLVVYGDEYRKENLRYVSNFWPIFERAACFIPRSGSPILAAAPEGEKYAREMSAWSDVRNIGAFACVSVPEEIDYPLAQFASLGEILKETLRGGTTLGVVGMNDIPAPLFQSIRDAVPDVRLADAERILRDIRMIKSPAEVACLREAGRLACLGYERLMEQAVPGNTELAAAGAGEAAARAAGAEAIAFMVFCSGERTATIIGRATQKLILDGEMIMAAMAVQYQGYTCTVGFPFVAGNASDDQKRLLGVLFKAANAQLGFLRENCHCGEMVRAVREVFERHGCSRFDVYPPLHGIGLAEAESPYPNAQSDYRFRSGMCVNSDISLFGHPAGSNRIEEGFVIGPDGPESLTPLIRRLVKRGGAD